MTTKSQLDALEEEIKSSLFVGTDSPVDPITDGVVDADVYLDPNNKPKILWILKEPVDDVSNGAPKGGGWSMTKDVLAIGKFGNRPPFAPIAYVTYSVFNGFKKWAEIDDVSDNPAVKAAIRRIGYININKMPALPTSGATDFGPIYGRNRSLLLKQIELLNPDILIFGSTTAWFLDDLGLSRTDFTPYCSLKFCAKGQRLFIDAYHPSRREHHVKTSDYVDEIVTVIKNHSLVLPAWVNSPA